MTNSFEFVAIFDSKNNPEMEVAAFPLVSPSLGQPSSPPCFSDLWGVLPFTWGVPKISKFWLFVHLTVLFFPPSTTETLFISPSTYIDIFTRNNL